MGLLVNHPEAGFVHGEAEELDRKLRQGDGVLWGGDSRLYLAVGVLEDRSVQPPRIGRRYEVRREMEDGSDQLIGHWRLEEFDRILFDLAPMKAAVDRPGSVPDVIERIDADNAKLEAEISTEIRDNLGGAMEHAAKLLHDTTEPGNVFRQVGGLRDEPVTSNKPADS